MGYKVFLGMQFYVGPVGRISTLPWRSLAVQNESSKHLIYMQRSEIVLEWNWQGFTHKTQRKELVDGGHAE